MDLNPEYIGYRLIERGFSTWFKYIFRVIENRPYNIEPIHPELLQTYDEICNGERTRQVINLPPRSSKTTLNSYLTAFALTLNPKSEIIYTSYSQDLLKEISSKVASILENSIYKTMYPCSNNPVVEDIFADPVNDFWREYLETTQKKNLYSSKLIKTSQGGVCLFSSIGAQITGFGVGIKGYKGFSGFLAIDDPNKPADVKYPVKRQNVLDFYSSTLLTRLNNSYNPIICVQQRLHIEDLSGLLENKYNFNVLRKPLLDDKGVCQIPSQYNQERIEELKKDNYSFQAQYQQQPILQGGNVIKSKWFKFYPISSKFEYKKIIMVADTAMKVKEHNDYSVFMVGGVSQDHKLHVLDLIRGKWEAPELKRKCKELWNKWQTGDTFCSSLHVEDKASGTGLIQEIKTECSIPIIPIEADKDKLTRLESVLAHIEAGNVLLPENELYSFNPDLLAECQEFSRDDSHKHDDQVDCLVYLIMNTIAKLKVSIYDVL